MTVALFKPVAAQNCPEKLEVSETVVHVERTATCKVLIPVQNKSRQNILFTKRALLGEVETVESCIQLPSNNECVDLDGLIQGVVNSCQLQPTVDRPSEKSSYHGEEEGKVDKDSWCPHVDLSSLNVEQMEL